MEKPEAKPAEKEVHITDGRPDRNEVRQKKSGDIKFVSEDNSYVIVAGDAKDLSKDLPLCIKDHGHSTLHVEKDARVKRFPYKIYNADGQSQSRSTAFGPENGDDPEIIVEE